MSVSTKENARSFNLSDLSAVLRVRALPFPIGALVAAIANAAGP